MTAPIQQDERYLGYGRMVTQAWKPTAHATPWEWCEEHVTVDNTSPMPGRWRSDNSPWVKEFMEVFAQNRIRDISVMCSAQSSKTQTLLCLMQWAIAEDPGPGLWAMAAKDEAEDFVRDRASSAFRACPAVAGLILRETKLNFTFATMPLYFVGAGSDSKLQGKPMRWLFLDEVRNYPPGALEKVLKRTRAYWNSRRVLISTPGKENDAVHRAFLAGDQRVFHFPCPACSFLQPLKMEQLKWDTNEITKPFGKWDFDAMSKTIRYECKACKHTISDTPAERKAIARTGRFVALNPHAPSSRVSFHWNAILPPWVPWRSVVEEFLEARSAARHGDIEPMRAFINETLGEPWKDELGEIDDYDFLHARERDYKFGDAWPEEKIRFMAADRQQAGGEHYWYVIRAFGLFGKSRLVLYGRCNTTEELEQIRKTNGVKVENAMIDSGYRASEVYRFCQASGWKAFKGSDSEWFDAKHPVTQQTFRQLWRRTLVDPHYGTKLQGKVRPIPLFQWSNPGIKDLLAEYMSGLIGDWTLPKGIDAEYLKQATADKRVEEVDLRGRVRTRFHQVKRDNHIKDCEEMIKVAAIVSKTIAQRVRQVTPAKSEAETADV